MLALCTRLLHSARFFLLLLFLVPLVSNAQQITITGIVTDQATKSPLAGVSVELKGSTTGSSTDASGKFSINVNDPKGFLVFTTVGFGRQEIAINNRTTINVEMSNSSTNLNEVVVIGYGTTQKKGLTGAVSSIKATQLENENPQSVQDILRGNIPGLNVTQSTSAKGGGDLLVRGKSSVNAGTSPLLVVDGVIYQGALSDINPNDIGSIDVLKDASSAAVFGAKSASGVILITTKKGSGNKPSITFNTNIGVAQIAQNEPLYGPEEFISWRRDVQRSRNINSTKLYIFDNPNNLPAGVTLAQWKDGQTSTDLDAIWLNRLGLLPIEVKNYKEGKTVDWYDRMFQTGLRQDHTVSLSGRKDEVSYYMSLGYTDNEGIIVGDRFKTFRARVNLEGRIAKWLTTGMNLAFSDRDESQVQMDWGQMVNASPYGQVFTDDGLRYRDSPNDDLGNNGNPYRDIAFVNRLQKYNTIFSSLYVKGDLPWGFSYRVSFTPNFEFYRYFNANSAKDPRFSARKGVATRTTQTLYNWQVDNVINWDKTFGRHQFNATFLYNAEKYQSWREQIDNEGFDPSDVLSWHNIGAGIKPVVSSDDQKSTGDALMGRMIYTYNDKYILTALYRRDGYSAFGLNNPRAAFQSYALGWVFSEEKFMNNVDWLSFGKLRASWGVVGNRDIGRYLALSDLTSGKYQYITPAGAIIPVSQLWVNRMQNDNLKWERTESYNLGLDISLFKNRVSLSVEAYQKSTKDLLLLRRLPTILGFDNVMSNIGEVENKGMEFTVNTTNIQQTNFVWRSNVNFWFNRNKIKHLYGPVNIYDAQGKVIGQAEKDDPANGWFIGQNLDVIWNQRVLGVWQQSEITEAAKYGVAPGDFKVQDVNGDFKYSDADRQFLGQTTPKYQFTVRNEFTIYKNFEFSFMVYANLGMKREYNQAKNNGGFQDRQNSYKFPYWTQENPINDYARLYSSNGSATFNVYRNSGFARLSTVALSYNMPKSIIQKARFSSARIYINVNNAAVYSPDWTFWDVEYGNTPSPRYYSLGLNVTL